MVLFNLTWCYDMLDSCTKQQIASDSFTVKITLVLTNRLDQGNNCCKHASLTG